MAQALDLWKDEPHPVAAFKAHAQLIEDSCVNWLLRIQKPLEIERVTHFSP